MSEALEVCAAVAVRGGRVLMATRREGDPLGGRWEFPGGKVEPGETLSRCIRRELREELDLHVRETSLLFRRECDRPGGGRLALNFMHCLVDDDQTAVGREGQQVGWFRWDEAERLDLAPADRALFAEVRRKTPRE